MTRTRAALIAASLALSLALFCIAPLPAAAAEPVSLSVTADKRYTMEVPKGLCHIDPNGHAADKMYVEIVTRQLLPENRLLAAFGDCPSLEKMRKKIDAQAQPDELHHWAHVTLPLLGRSEPRPIPQGMARAEVLELLQRAGAGDPSVDISLAVRQLTSAPADQDLEPKNIGMLGRDKTAFFTGLLWREREAGKTRLVGGVQAMTMVGEYALSVNDFRTYAGRDSLDAAVADTREIVRGLIARNEK